MSIYLLIFELKQTELLMRVRRTGKMPAQQAPRRLDESKKRSPRESALTLLLEDGQQRVDALPQVDHHAYAGVMAGTESKIRD